jgi:two-component system, NarL family, sensor kinase
MPSSGPTADPNGPSSFERGISAVVRFALSGLVVLLLVGVGAALLIARQSEQEALRDARVATSAAGRDIIQPMLNDSLLTGDRAAVRRVDRVVKKYVLGGSVVRVKIWTPDGRIIYSDEPRLIGSHYELGHEELETLEANRVEAEVSDLNEPENRFERDQGQLIEVYRGLTTWQGHHVLFETYWRSASLAGTQRRVVLQFLPVLLVALLLLWLVQLPLARSMVRRLREGQLEREKLLGRAIEASETERRRVAHDLHDGVLQDLAGLSYELAAAADTARRNGSTDLRDQLVSASAAARQSVRRLRSLLIDIYPANLHMTGLPAVLTDLASSIQAHGIDVQLEIPDQLELPKQTEALVFRAAQEAVRNAMSHSKAGCLRVKLFQRDGRVALTVIDDGVGFSRERLEQREKEGHMGLRLLSELVGHSGGRLSIDSEPGRGTRVHLEVPAA